MPNALPPDSFRKAFDAVSSGDKGKMTSSEGVVKVNDQVETRRGKKLLEITDRLVGDLRLLQFSSPVAYVYNPLVYAREPHLHYLSRYGGGGREAVFVGMNPGPWGMAQTGVPFGEIDIVKNWLGIDGKVDKPQQEHPKKRIEGFRCRRSEVSGRRLWGLFRERCGTPEKFFERFFVVNYCPLLFLDADGRNITPDKLKSGERAPLLAACDSALLRCIEQIGPARVIGVGNFAQERAQEILKESGVRVGKILHPSPASPAANKGWENIVLDQLRDQGIEF
jgi:single-strand selective monofunctional uracil DNA glycosylase